MQAELKTPRSTKAREDAPVWGVLLLLAALAWVVTTRQASEMGAGAVMSSLPPFLGFWVVMMIAMMFPSVAPNLLLWTRTIRQSNAGVRRAGRIGSYLGGYLVSWTVFGVAVFALMVAVDSLTQRSAVIGPWIGAAIFAAAGLYQLTPLKQACLTKCRAPLGLFLQYSGYKGATKDLRAGMHHGAYCVACCWGLMAVLVAVGMMNVGAMAVIAAVIVLERLWGGGPAIARIVGTALLVLAVMALFSPWLVPGLQHTTMPMT